MAFTRALSSYRPTRRTLRIAGAVALTAAVTGPLATPAAAAVTATVQHETGLTQAMAVSDALAERVGHQADSQEQAAEARQAAEQAAKAKRAAEAKKQVEAEKKAAAEKAAKAAKAEKAAAAEKARKAAEKERAAKKRSDRTTKRVNLNAFTSPVSGGKVTTQYNSGGAMWSSGTHSGIDFAAAQGTPVNSAGSGTVVEAGWGGAYGNNIVVRHTDGHFTQYGHLSAMNVSVGQKVTSGQQIGRVGSTGNSTGPHLHFEARTGQSYGSDINPVNYLRGKGVGLG